MTHSLDDFIYQHPVFSNPERKGESYLTDCPVCHKRHMYVSQKGNKIVVFCQHSDCNAGMNEVAETCGISRFDFFVGEPQKKKLLEKREHIYHYENGNIFGKKIIKKYDNSDKKEVFWQKYENGQYIKGLNRATAPLFNLPDVATSQDPELLVVEGEKDVETMKKLGFVATSLPNGGRQTKWVDEYSKYFKGKTVYIIGDNDETGQKYGVFVAKNVFPVAESVKVISATDIYPKVQQKGDITDIVKIIGEDAAIHALGDAINRTANYSPAENEIPFTVNDNSFFNLFVPLEKIEEKEAKWLSVGRIPQGAITIICGDGGVGKTSFEIDLLTAISTGTRSILDDIDMPEREPGFCAFFTTEESIEIVMKRKLREAGVDQKMVYTLDPQNDKAQEILREFYFDSNHLRTFIEHFKPVLCIFDPIQGFLPPDLQMGSRNAMRHCLSPLIGLGEKYGTTFVLIMHTNKRSKAYGRERMADSADLWDISRSVLMFGKTDEPGINYISCEKGNYTQGENRIPTVLFSFDDNGNLVFEGTTDKKDRDYQVGKNVAQPKAVRNECKQAIFDILQAAPLKSMFSDDLTKELMKKGYTFATIKRAKSELTKSGTIKNHNEGFGKEKKWKTSLIGAMPDDDS